MARVYVNDTVERNMASVVGQNISPRVLGVSGSRIQPFSYLGILK